MAEEPNNSILSILEQFSTSPPDDHDPFPMFVRPIDYDRPDGHAAQEPEPDPSGSALITHELIRKLITTTFMFERTGQGRLFTLPEIANCADKFGKSPGVQPELLCTMQHVSNDLSHLRNLNSYPEADEKIWGSANPYVRLILQMGFGHITMCGGAPAAHLRLEEADDYDFFFLNLSPEEATVLLQRILEKLEELGTALVTNHDGPKFKITRNKFVVTATTMNWPKIKLQFVLRIYTSHLQILSGFDVWGCKVGYDLENGFYTSATGAFAMATGVMAVDLGRASTSFGHRLGKYAAKGMRIIFPGLRPDGPNGISWSNDLVRPFTLRGSARTAYSHYLTNNFQFNHERGGKFAGEIASDYDALPPMNFWYIEHGQYDAFSTEGFTLEETFILDEDDFARRTITRMDPFRHFVAGAKAINFVRDWVGDRNSHELERKMAELKERVYRIFPNRWNYRLFRDDQKVPAFGADLFSTEQLHMYGTIRVNFDFHTLEYTVREGHGSFYTIGIDTEPTIQRFNIRLGALDRFFPDEETREQFIMSYYIQKNGARSLDLWYNKIIPMYIAKHWSKVESIDKITWKTKDPGEQRFGQVNPTEIVAEDWYGSEYYRPTHAGLLPEQAFAIDYVCQKYGLTKDIRRMLIVTLLQLELEEVYDLFR